MHFQDRSADQAIRWAEAKLSQLLHNGNERQAAVNDVLLQVSRQWGADCERAVEMNLHIHYETPKPSAIAQMPSPAATEVPPKKTGGPAAA